MKTDLSYHAAIDGKQDGPFDFDALGVLIKQGKFNKETLVWKQGMADWVPAGEVAELAPVFAPPPPPAAATAKPESPPVTVTAKTEAPKVSEPNLQQASSIDTTKEEQKLKKSIFTSVINIILGVLICLDFLFEADIIYDFLYGLLGSSEITFIFHIIGLLALISGIITLLRAKNKLKKLKQ